MTALEEALAELKSLKEGEKPQYKKTAEKYGISPTTLSRHFRGVQGTKNTQYANQRFLNDQQAKTLIRYINKLSSRGLYPSHNMIRNFAREIAQKEPGKQWVYRFLQRHEDQLLSQYITAIDSLRRKADSAYKYQLYFDMLERKLAEYEILPENMYNMDEKGFLIGILPKCKRVFSKESYEKGSMQRLQDGSREWITTIACICGDGSSLSPGLIYKAASCKIQDTWLQDFDRSKHDAFFTFSPSGWTNDALGIAWLQDIFNRETKEKARRRWRLLILDGHGSHVTMKFLDFCDNHKIIPFTFPPYSTHSLQPLDVGIFSPLSRAYGEELEAFLYAAQGLSALSKRDFFRLFWPAWNKALLVKNIESAWKATGLLPFDPEVVVSRFTVAQEERPSSSDSTRSILQAEDWRRIDRLLRGAVGGVIDEKFKKLSSTLHHLATQNILLQHENQGLQQTILNEKSKRQRGKPLQLQLQAPEDGNAIFYSPQKIQQARDLQAQKEEAIQRQKANREDEKERRRLAKEARDHIQEEKKKEQAFKREQRIQEAEARKQEKERQKEEARIAKEADIQLQNDFKATRKGKKRSPATSKPRNTQKVALPAPEEVPEASSATSRRGREIRLPHRFRDD